MSTHFDELLDGLLRRCLNMGRMVQTALQQSVTSLLARQPEDAKAVLEEEKTIDAEEVEIEKQAINLLALHQPAAGDLRTVFAIVKINGDLERIADCAVNIAQQVGPFSVPHAEFAEDGIRELRIMAELVLKQLDQTLSSLESKNDALADAVCRGDDAIDAMYNQLLQGLQAGMITDSRKVPANLALILVARNLERIGDHCTNIAEDVVFRLRGRIVRHTHDPR